MALIIITMLVILILTSGLWVVSNRLPKEYQLSRAAYFNSSPSELWEIIIDFVNQPSWIDNLAHVEKLPSRNGKDVWKEINLKGESTTLVTTEKLPHRLIVRHITEGYLQFTGSRTIEIREFGEIASLTVTDSGTIENPLLRFISHYVVNQYSGIDLYIYSLAKKLGQEITIT